MRKFWKPSIEILLIIVIIAVALWSSKVVLKSDFTRDLIFKFGYLGVFLTSVVNGFNPLIQVPIVSFLPLFVGVGLSKWMLIFVITFAMTIADIGIYVLGKLGGKYVHQKKIEKESTVYLNSFYKNHHWVQIAIVFFFAAAVPLPNELVLVPLAFMGCRLIPLMPAMFFGNFVFNIVAGEGFLAISQVL